MAIVNCRQSSPIIIQQPSARTGQFAPSFSQHLSTHNHSHYNSHHHHPSLLISLNGLPFHRDALPHAYFKLSLASNNRSIKEDPSTTIVDEDSGCLSFSTTSTSGVNLNQFVVAPTSCTTQLSWHALDMSGIGLRQLSRTSPLFGNGFGFSSLVTSLTGLYLTANFLQELPPEIGLLKNLTILHLGYNRLVTLSPAVGYCTQLKELQLQENELCSLPSSIGNLHRLVSLNLEGNPWSDPLLLSVLANIGSISSVSATSSSNISPGSSALHATSVLSNRTASLIIPFLRDNVSVGVAQPPPRRWEVLGSNLNPNTQATNDPPILVLSWNILAEIYADPSRYGYTPSWALSWPYRQESIIQTLRASGADFIILQEVEVPVFHALLEELRMDSSNYYEGVFQPKHRFRTLSTVSNDPKASPVDGVCIFWRFGRFSLDLVAPIEFCSPSLLSERSMSSTTLRSSLPMNSFSILEPGPPILGSSSDLFNRAMLKDNVALLTRFKRLDCASCPSLILGSVHLQWDESFKDVKMLQASILSQKLQQMAALSDSPSIIISGDFNAVIGSGTYSILSEGTISSDHPDWLGFSYPPFTDPSTGASVKRVGLPFKSAYHFEMTVPLTEDNRISTVTDTFSGLIDYIWFSESSLQVTGRLALPTAVDASLEGLVGLPSIHFPSDHLPLMTEFVQLVKVQEEAKSAVPALHPGKGLHRVTR